MLQSIVRFVARHRYAALFVAVCVGLVGFAIMSRAGSDAERVRAARALASPMALTQAYSQFGVSLGDITDEAARGAYGDDVTVLANHDPEGFDPSLTSAEGYVTVFVFGSVGERERHEPELVGDGGRVFSAENVVVLYAPGLRDVSDRIGELTAPIAPRLDVIGEP